MERKYTVYKITSSCGKYYIGYTSQALKERWRQHVNRALNENYAHPFYDAIRKYGEETFEVERLEILTDRVCAMEKECQFIKQAPIEELFNLSSGGINDAHFGGKIFWEKINADPVARKAYLSKLSSIKKENDWTDYDDLVKKAMEWRKENPREAYKNSHRAQRMSRNKNTKKVVKTTNRDRKENLMYRFKRSEIARENAIKQWAERTQEERQEIFDKISVKAKERMKLKTKEERQEITRKARESIDRNKQGAAASKGLKLFWEELKKDPERYDEYMRIRTNTLMKTLKESKLNENV